MIPNDNELHCLNGNFLCGVVEGFYGRPWTTKQRHKLFQRMRKMGMTTYLYAPKDDCKHRVYWRDLYSVEEADHLSDLIQAATESDVTFVYALSPGLDINYSNAKEVQQLKRKLEQVSSFGCKAFALLFDDIEVDMCEADKEIFQSFAQAQVAVTNEVYQHLEQPATFLFCPTEYCASRAVPNVCQSEYLNTIGSKLLPGIDIMWTGGKVISKIITLESVQEISKVLQRPPVIWDNIHANDYDQKRLFLGPYDGRSPELIPYLRGVLTNPNCEFEANYVAMHTLAQWSKSNMETVKKDVILSSSPVCTDIKLETQGDTQSDDPVPYQSYQPKVALKVALKDWLTEFYDDCDAPKGKLPAAPAPSVIAPPLAGSAAPAIPIAVAASLGVGNINELNGLESFMQPVPGAPVNSLVDPLPSSDSESESVDVVLEPMDCAVTPSTSPVASSLTLPPAAEKDAAKALVLPEVMDTDMAEAGSRTEEGLTLEELNLLVDMFYLPFEHGSKGVDMLVDFNWLMQSSHVVSEARCQSATTEQIQAAADWHQRADKFHEDVAAFQAMLTHICEAPNKALLFDLYPYLWDMKVSLSLLVTYLKWLGVNKAYKDAFRSGDQEAWMFRGGLQSEFQRLLPLESVLDLTQPAVPATPAPFTHQVRPYSPADREAVYQVCRRTCDDGADGTDIFPAHADLVADKLIGAFLENPEYSFVIEDSEGVCGYVLAALDAKVHMSRLEEAWLPRMQEKYPKPDKADQLSPAEEMICSFHSHKSFMCEQLYVSHPSIVRLDALPARCPPHMARHGLAAAVAALKTNGSHGLYAEVHVGDRNTIDRLAALCMNDLLLPDCPEDLVLVGRVV